MISTIINFTDRYGNLPAIPIVIISLYLYFRDPFNRWTFLGYLPTAILVIFDVHEHTVLITQNKGTWGLPQGGIFSNDVTGVVEKTLRRELGVEENIFEIRYAKPLQTIRIKDKLRTRRVTIGRVSLFRNIKGKAYIAYFLVTDEANFNSMVKPGYGVGDCKFLPFSEAKKFFKQTTHAQNVKSNMIFALLKEAEEYAKDYKISLKAARKNKQLSLLTREC